jgi:Family of unknown function (DUF5681)
MASPNGHGRGDEGRTFVIEKREKEIVRGDFATRWKPGQSGNPGGRPKRMPLTDVTREKLPQLIPGDETGRTFAEAIDRPDLLVQEK